MIFFPVILNNPSPVLLTEAMGIVGLHHRWRDNFFVDALGRVKSGSPTPSESPFSILSALELSEHP
jgi:hypothetical protein